MVPTEVRLERNKLHFLKLLQTEGNLFGFKLFAPSCEVFI